jgi:hypothetical protein
MLDIKDTYGDLYKVVLDEAASIDSSRTDRP